MLFWLRYASMQACPREEGHLGDISAHRCKTAVRRWSVPWRPSQTCRWTTPLECTFRYVCWLLYTYINTQLHTDISVNILQLWSGRTGAHAGLCVCVFIYIHAAHTIQMHVPVAWLVCMHDTYIHKWRMSKENIHAHIHTFIHEIKHARESCQKNTYTYIQTVDYTWA